jgi:hypothetical protein
MWSDYDHPMASPTDATRADRPAPPRPRRTARARWALSLSALALALWVTGSSAAVTPKPLPINVHGAWVTRTVDDRQVSISVPSDWSIGEPWVIPGSFAYLVGSFSNQLLSSPCTTSANSIDCGPPLTTLQPGGILVEVFSNSAINPDWTIGGQQGAPTTVSGLTAQLDVETGSQGPCTELGADRSRTELIAYPQPPEDYVEIAVCSRGLADWVGARVMASVRVVLLG